MNLFQLVFKQMRQRALGTWLTLLSVTLGVALAVAIMVLYREAGHLFGQTSFGYELIVGKQGSATQLVMNTVYHVDQSVGNVPYAVYESMLDPERNLPPEKRKRRGGLFGAIRRPAATTAAVAVPATDPSGEQPDAAYDYSPDVKIAIPIVVGDTYQGRYRIVGTTTNMFGIDDEKHSPLDHDHFMPYRPEDPDSPARYYEFADGHCFYPTRFEAVLGSEVAAKSDLRMGSVFQATHGETPPVGEPDVHPEKWKVVGVLKPTHTAADACVFIPILSDYTIEDHALGAKTRWILQHGGQAPKPDADPDEVHAYKMVGDDFELFVPKAEWEVSAILVKTRGFPEGLIYKFRARHDAMAVSPAQTMREFFDRFLKPSERVLLVVAFMVSVVAAVGILVSIYNSVAARGREIAIMRALGATRLKVLTLICAEAGLIGLAGGLLGLFVAHAASAVASVYFERMLGEGINWHHVAMSEWLYLLGIVVVAVLAGFVPAAKAYRTPVATNLVAG